MTDRHPDENEDPEVLARRILSQNRGLLMEINELGGCQGQCSHCQLFFGHKDAPSCIISYAGITRTPRLKKLMKPGQVTAFAEALVWLDKDKVDSINRLLEEP